MRATRVYLEAIEGKSLKDVLEAVGFTCIASFTDVFHEQVDSYLCNPRKG